MGAFQHRRGDTGADVGLAVVYLALRSSGPASSELLPNEHRRAAHNKRTAAGEHGSDPEPTGFLSPRLCCPLTGDEWWKENAILGGLRLCLHATATLAHKDELRDPIYCLTSVKNVTNATPITQQN